MVNNAGIAHSDDLPETTEAEYDRLTTYVPAGSLIRSCVPILGYLRDDRRFETDAAGSDPRGGTE